jgi:hypothetical protein
MGKRGNSNVEIRLDSKSKKSQVSSGILIKKGMRSTGFDPELLGLT